MKRDKPVPSHASLLFYLKEGGLNDLQYYRIVQITFRGKQRSLSESVQKYHIRRVCMFTVKRAVKVLKDVVYLLWGKIMEQHRYTLKDV